jgi:hypothetical protein
MHRLDRPRKRPCATRLAKKKWAARAHLVFVQRGKAELTRKYTLSSAPFPPLCSVQAGLHQKHPPLAKNSNKRYYFPSPASPLPL